VTLVTGFVGKTGDLELLTKLLNRNVVSEAHPKMAKLFCRETRDKVVQALTKEGYKASAWINKNPELSTLGTLLSDVALAKPDLQAER